MNWRIKAALLNLFDAVPGGAGMHYWLQRNLTGSIPRSAARFARAVEQACDLAERFNRHSPRRFGDASLLEIGAGRDLAGPLTFYCLGAASQLVLDAHPLAKPDLVGVAVDRLAGLPRRDLPRLPSQRLGADAWADLERLYGIRYRAPVDAWQTGLADRSIDGVTSTNTFEHIPVDEIRAILREWRRILRPGGIVAMRINYEDHYAFFDPNITRINFLRYSDAQWRRYNPGIHYQNRLRHRDYLQLFEEAGFRLLDAATTGPGPREIEAAGRLPLDERFRAYGVEELGIGTGWVVLAQPG